MGEIYGLYSTRDGVVRYVSQTEYTARKGLDLTVTKALDREPGALFDWLRDEWRTGHEVKSHVLQDDIIAADLEMFETYWIKQFSSLLNIESLVDPARATSAVGQRINDTIRALLRGESVG